MSGTWIVKTAATNRASNTTATDDPDLQVVLNANTTYRIRALALWDSNATADFKYRWHFTGTKFSAIGHRDARNDVARTTLQTPVDGFNVGNGTQTADTVVARTGSGTANTQGLCWIDMLIEVDTSGTFSLQWAQNTSNVSAASVLSRSWMYVETVT